MSGVLSTTSSRSETTRRACSCCRNNLWERFNLIRNGPPKIRQVSVTETARVTEHKICKLEYGARRLFMGVITILLVGETGAGKTLMVDALVNYIFGIKDSDNFRLRIVRTNGSERAPENQRDGQSQTEWITIYTIHPPPEAHICHHTINIIDSPGFMDTRGADMFITQQIDKLFNTFDTYGIENYVSCVCFVAKSDLNRLTNQTKEVIQKTLALFGKDISHKLFICGTHHGSGSENLLNVLNGAGVEYTNFFFFENAWLIKPEANASTSYTECYDSCTRIFNILCTTAPCSITLSIETLKARTVYSETAQSCLDLYLAHVNNLCGLAQIQKTLEGGRAMPGTVIEKVQTASYTKNMCCTKCKVVCIPNIGRFKKLEQSLQNKCKNCECLVSFHIFENVAYQTHEEIVEILPGNARYSLPDDTTAALNQIKEKQQLIRKKMSPVIADFHSVVAKLQTIALRPNIPLVCVELQRLITDVDRNAPGSAAKIRALEELKNNVDGGNESNIVDRLEALLASWVD